MPDLERKELSGHPQRAQPSQQGWFPFLMGLPFILIGSAFVLIWLGVLPMPPGRKGPEFIIGAVGLAFASAGAALSSAGLRVLLRKREARRLARERPGEPWMADHPWDRRGARDNPFGDAAGSFGCAGFFAVFLAPFNWWAFFSDESSWVVVLVTSVFDLIGLFCLGYGVYLLAKGLKYGRTELVFMRFPFHPGGRLEVELRCAGPVRAADGLTATLRYIEERYEARGTGKNKSVRHVCDQLYADVLKIPFAGGVLKGGARIPIAFPLPEGEYATRMTADLPRYWELEVKADTPGVDFHAAFLVPVYAGTK